MTNPSPLSLLLIVLLAVSPLPPAAAVAVRTFDVVGTSSQIQCVGGVVYAANSTYEANRRRLTSLLLAEAAAGGHNPYYYTHRAVGFGYWPFRPQGSFFCRPHRRRRDVNDTGDSSCAACIAGAFLEMEKACPYHKETSFYGRSCSLHLDQYRIFGTPVMHEGNMLKHALASGLIFQAIGFGWLFFLLMQEWRSQKRGTMMHSTPLLSGD